ncbi:discoidin domain-containing protein [uncultured Bacteroides sp.]|uniref:discoidin domain-containing protein n=1 Tax=uncultured Bacteroides sp. TaxID=162156 RepID=UPI0026758ED1|nr:discoidin domain-containing protein [uncultured Bacteroides sp.]
MKIFYSLFLMTLLSVVSIGCSDNNVEWESDEIPSDKITLDVQGILDLLHNESVVVKILTGNGSYQVDSQDENIAKAKVVSENEIEISAVSTSEQDQYTTIYVIDEKKQTAEIKVCVGKMKELQLDIPDNFEIYTDVEEDVQVVTGNGGYIFSLSGDAGVVELGVYVDDTHTFSIKALKTGTAKLTVTDKRNKSKEITIQVKKADIRITEFSVPLSVGLTLNSRYNLGENIVIKPANASYKKLSYTLLGNSVSVDENGVLTAIRSGQTTVRVKTLDGSNKTAECVVTVVEPGSMLTPLGWTVDCSSMGVWGDNDNPANIIDNNTATWWEPGYDTDFIDEWIRIDMKYVQQVGKISIARRTSGNEINVNLKAVKVEGSVDGQNYFDLGTAEWGQDGNNYTDLENELWRDLVLANPVEVRYVKITVTELFSNNPCIACVNLYAPETN